MIKPEDLKNLPQHFMDTLRDIENFIIKDVCRRVAKEGQITDTALHQIERAAKRGADIKALERYISKATGAAVRDIDREIRSLISKSIDIDNAVYRRAGYDPIDISRSPELSEAVEAGIKQTKGELRNITRSMGFRDKSGGITHYKKIYDKVLDTASMLVLGGGLDYISATRIASKSLTENGLEWVNYATGHFNRADVAARRAIVTGVNQMSAQMNEILMTKLGAEYVEVTAHAGARPDHKEWQGKVYHVGGTKDGYPDFELATEYGSGAGLCGWNCRHSFFPFFPGISERVYSDEYLANIDPPDFTYNGRKYTHYEATQRQRQLETAIRKTKREILAAENLGDKELMLAKSIKLKSQMEHYKHFCFKGHLKWQMERTQVKGFGRSVAQRSVAAVKKKEKALNYINMEEYKKFAEICKSKATEKELFLINAHNYNGVRKGYFQTANSFFINRALRYGKENYLPQHDKLTVNTLKNVISRVETKKTYLLHRADDERALSYLFNGRSVDEIIKSGVAKGKIVQTKQFISTSMIKDKNLFNQRPVHWRIRAKRGSHGFANGYEDESEFVLSTGQKMKILNIFRKNGKIIVDAEIGGG